MKKLLSALFAVTLIAGPAMAGGTYRTKPVYNEAQYGHRHPAHAGHHHHQHVTTHTHYVEENTSNCATCDDDSNWFWDATKFVAKLPFRIVTSATKGIFDILADQDLSGFEEGYEFI
jgi:hypothetical protein